jgi:hypothetical protein
VTQETTPRDASSLVTFPPFRGLASIRPEADDVASFTSRWALPVMVTFGHNGSAYEAPCTVQSVQRQGDGTYRYEVRVIAMPEPDGFRLRGREDSMPPNLPGHGTAEDRGPAGRGA